MKKLIIIVTTLMVMLSCSTTKEAKSTRIELRNEKKLAEQAIIKKAVESRRFIIKFDRLYFSHGGMIDLIPRANFIIIDGEKTIISAAYLGRQYDIKPIAGISMRGETLKYALTNDLSKGMYEIKMKVTNRGNSFDVYLTIDKNGKCDASLTNIRIDFVRYSGYIVPIEDKIINTPQKSIMI